MGTISRSSWFPSARKRRAASLSARLHEQVNNCHLVESASQSFPRGSQETPHHPVVARRRKSLGDVFHSVKAVKWSLDEDPVSDSSNSPVESGSYKKEAPEAMDDTESHSSITTSESGPPRIEVPSELNQGNIQRSSTFRSFLEKAATDINIKYGLARSLSTSRNGGRLSSWSKTHSADTEIEPKSVMSRPRFVVDTSSIAPAALFTDSTVASCKSCGSRVCCRSKDKRGIPVHQVEKILEQSIHLRNPSRKSPPIRHSETAGGSDYLIDSSLSLLKRPIPLWNPIRQSHPIRHSERAGGSGYLINSSLSLLCISEECQSNANSDSIGNESTATSNIPCPEHYGAGDVESVVYCREKYPVTPGILPMSHSCSADTLNLPSRAVSASTYSQLYQTQDDDLIHLGAWIDESTLQRRPKALIISTALVIEAKAL
ncbi:hypothetical protein B0J13DRAFT_529403 [Dactylonectria estremocensis]|uniref:Uncharacterized protein n=1 Tax=Dactylonectria estremocensis TaxID=1079267 RepID=A0A9P9IUC8_9HYPO|nr:hypothetical protein B0J13DRAFT_529403 [Dactylonectria estremocensis]